MKNLFGSSVLPQLSPQSYLNSFMFGLLRRYESHLSPKHQKGHRNKKILERRGARAIDQIRWDTASITTRRCCRNWSDRIAAVILLHYRIH